MALGFFGLLMLHLCGCLAVVAGVATGAGTAVWLSGKLTQEFHAPYPATVDAARSAMHALNLQITKETNEERMTQIRGTYSDGREMWIDVHQISKKSTRVEVRVGAVNADKQAASLILKKIQTYL